MDNHGKRNLIILGIGAIIITVVTTGVSLWAYRTSGDIYLDRSRPGYLPDKVEAGEESNANSGYEFNETSAELTSGELKEYLKELKAVNDRIKALTDPYAPGPLSNESLGIPAESEPSEEKR